MAFGHRRARRLAITATALAAALVGTAASTPAAGATGISPDASVRVTDLGTLANSVCCSQANDINEAGDIVGWSNTGPLETDPMHAVIWHHGHIKDLGTLGGDKSEAKAINKFGTVVGWAEDAGGNRRAAMWKGGQVIDLGDFGGPTGMATDINNNGGVVGTADDPAQHPQGFIWRNGVMTKLNAPAGTQLQPTAINDNGRIAVTIVTAPNDFPRAARYDNGKATPLTTDFSHSAGLTEHGVISGSVSRNGHEPAFVFKGGTLTTLPLPAGSNSAEAFDITNNCHAVGAAVFDDTQPTRPVHWRACGAPVRLPGLSGGFQGRGAALAINESNQIVGWSTLAANGPFHAVLWTS